MKIMDEMVKSVLIAQKNQFAVIPDGIPRRL